MSSLVKVFLNGEKVKTFGNETLQLEPLVTRLSNKLVGHNWSFSVYDKAQGRQPCHFKCSGYLIYGKDSMTVQYNKKGASSKTPFTFDKCVSYLYINMVDLPLFDIQVWRTNEEEIPSTPPQFRQYTFNEYWSVLEQFLTGSYKVWVNDSLITDVTEEMMMNITKDCMVNCVKVLVKETNVKPSSSYFWWGQN